MAFHYVELFDALGLGEVILGGVSLGGWIAAEFAARWPERVKKLWLSAAPGLWVEEQPLPDLFREMTDRQKRRDPAVPRPAGLHGQVGDRRPRGRGAVLSAYQSLTVLARLVWERPYDPKLASRLHRVQCPTLLLWGATTGSCRRPTARRTGNSAARGMEDDPGVRPPGDVREGSGVRRGGDEVLPMKSLPAPSASEGFDATPSLALGSGRDLPISSPADPRSPCPRLGASGRPRP